MREDFPEQFIPQLGFVEFFQEFFTQMSNTDPYINSLKSERFSQQRFSRRVNPVPTPSDVQKYKTLIWYRYLHECKVQKKELTVSEYISAVPSWEWLFQAPSTD